MPVYLVTLDTELKVKLEELMKSTLAKDFYHDTTRISTHFEQCFFLLVFVRVGRNLLQKLVEVKTHLII